VEHRNDGNEVPDEVDLLDLNVELSQEMRMERRRPLDDDIHFHTREQSEHLALEEALPPVVYSQGRVSGRLQRLPVDRARPELALCSGRIAHRLRPQVF